MMPSKPSDRDRFDARGGDSPTTFNEDSSPFVSTYCAVDEELVQPTTSSEWKPEEFLQPMQLSMGQQFPDRDHSESPTLKKARRAHSESPRLKKANRDRSESPACRKTRQTRSKAEGPLQNPNLADDIEMLGKDSPESEHFDRLKPVKLQSLVIGQDYEYRDRRGDFFPVKIVSKDMATGNFVGESLFRKGQMFNRIKAHQCIESAAPATTNWVSYIFWVLFDFGLTAALGIGLYFAWADIVEPHLSWGQHVFTYGIALIVLFARLLWHFALPTKRHATAVPHFVSRKVEMDGKEVYFVGTMHVSPGSARDVANVIDEVDPDVVMIELDYDRLAAMKESENPKPLDQFLFQKPNGTDIRGIHTDWNANLNKLTIEGTLTFENSMDLTGKILVAPYMKSKHAHFVYSAQKRGAVAVFFLDIPIGAAETGNAEPSTTLVETNGFFSLWRFFCATGRNTPPEIPCYLVPAQHFDLLLDEGVMVTFTVNAGNLVSPSTCRQECVRTSCVLGTGIGVMYGLIRMAGCKVGEEFLTADRLAKERGKVLATIDMGIGRLGNQLLQRLIPFPSNVWYMLTAWAAVSRIVLTWIFLPQTHKLDLALNMCWGFVRFRLRTWFAFFLGAIMSSLILWGILMVVEIAVASSVEASVSAAGSSEDEAQRIAEWVGFGLAIGIPVYLLPVVYKGLLDSRDEQMYRGAVAQIRLRPNASKFLIVIGAAHSNGMIRRMYQRGFMPHGNVDHAKRKWAPFPFNTACGMPLFY